jgi:hypothetical protein
VDLSPEETAQILRQREARTPKVDEQQSNLLRQLAELNDRNLTLGYGDLPRNLDLETLALIKKVQAVGIGMKTEPYGDARPIAIPSRVALEIIKAVRGDAQSTAGNIRVRS